MSLTQAPKEQHKRRKTITPQPLLFLIIFSSVVLASAAKVHIYRNRPKKLKYISKVTKFICQKARKHFFISKKPVTLRPEFKYPERCPSGLRSTPGKCVYGKTVSGVRIPVSPPPKKIPDSAGRRGFLRLQRIP